MKRITRKLWCHLSLTDEKTYSVEDVRKSTASPVSTFSELIKHIAHISYRNPQYSLFFRAQAKDHRNSQDSSSLFPSIYRNAPVKSRGRILGSRFANLKKAEAKLLREFDKQRFLGTAKLTKFKEIRWSLLQHYSVCETPLLDITQSLRVACSFALDSGGDHSFVFVLGLPHVNGSISYSVEEELLNIKLLSICPPDALRPYFQEGFLVGSFPSSEETRSPSLDVAKRLVAKFKLNHDTFSDENFTPIPHGTLYPQGDIMERVCNRVKNGIEAEEIQ